jgi:hypothetical protein
MMRPMNTSTAGADHVRVEGTCEEGLRPRRMSRSTGAVLLAILPANVTAFPASVRVAPY